MANPSSKATSLRRSNLSLHNILLWWGAACVLIWTLSGLTHPLMSWFGPKQASYRPPALTLDVIADSALAQGIALSELKTMTSVLVQAQLDQVSIAKVVPSADGPMLQLTYDQSQPRQYVPLMALVAQPNSSVANLLSSPLTAQTLVKDAMLENYDETQARWLASHYTGRSQDEIKQVIFQTEFDGDYPWVNRLLPVYKVYFKGNGEDEGDDQLTAYIHTESLQLAGLANQTRLRLQTVFRALHTFDFLDAQDNIRVVAVFLAMLVLVGVSVSGLGLVILIKRRKIKQSDRKWHRRLGYVLWLPLFAWSISGCYHLIQAAFVDAPAGMRLNPVFDFGQFSGDQSLNESLKTRGEESSTASDDELKGIDGASILAASLMNLDGQLVYRLSVTKGHNDHQVTNGSEGPHSHHQALVKKYKGNPSETSSLYVDAFSLMPLTISDKDRAWTLATEFTGLSSDAVLSIDKVTHFGPDYDFRNKRLPVWKVSFDDSEQRQVFVDPATNLLVDQTRSVDRAERWSFSILHKWNHLIPLTGRFKRDVIIVITLAFITLITVFGIRMALARRARLRRKQKEKTASGLNDTEVGDAS
ncbi:PepSY domain-containing protein [Litoribrevibacter euphylliae]|uniref:PepSY domain-containing protein n=1 Tax=Litoribrevibacter euphylliae TaxID=1834034 RepID=A0ABV7HF85_9GAMM